MKIVLICMEKLLLLKKIFEEERVLKSEENQKVLIKEKAILSQIEKFNKRYDKKILRDIKFFII